MWFSMILGRVLALGWEAQHFIYLVWFAHAYYASYLGIAN